MTIPLLTLFNFYQTGSLIKNALIKNSLFITHKSICSSTSSYIFDLLSIRSMIHDQLPIYISLSYISILS